MADRAGRSGPRSVYGPSAGGSEWRTTRPADTDAKQCPIGYRVGHSDCHCVEEIVTRATQTRKHQGGLGAPEYLAVLVGLMAVWRGAQTVLTLLQQHHTEYSWALMIPF